MNNYRKFNLLFIIISITLICLICLCACGGGEKSEKDIAAEIVSLDTYFSGYDLSLDEYTIEKRQTNKDEKNDYVWLSLKGHNDNFAYSAQYKLTYILYNDGWHLEESELIDSDYSATSEFDYSIAENNLSSKYDNYEILSKDEKKNQIVIVSTATKTQNYFLDTYAIELIYEFKPSTGWKETDCTEAVTNSRLAIVGEWKYQDNDRYYYIHVKSVDDFNKVTYKYLMLNTAMNDELNYVVSDGYVTELYLPYISEFTGLDSNTYCRAVDVYDDHYHIGGDEYCFWVWTKETLMVNGDKGSGFYFENHFLERLNESEEPIVGCDDAPSIDKEKAIQSNNFIYKEEDYLGKIIDFCNNGNLNDAKDYISGLDESQKSDEIINIEYQIDQFLDKYSSWLGNWGQDPNNNLYSLIIRSGYDEDYGIILQFEEKASFTEPMVYDLYSEEGNVIMYHNHKRFFDYTTLTMIDEDIITSSTFSENTRKTSSEITLYKKK